MTMLSRLVPLSLLAVTACASSHAGDRSMGGLIPMQRPCPDWSRSSIEDFSNRAPSNFGCADEVNFHAQLARPQDAVLGRGSVTGAADSAVTAIDRMRTRPPIAWPAAGAAGAAGAPAAQPGPGN